MSSESTALLFGEHRAYVVIQSQIVSSKTYFFVFYTSYRSKMNKMGGFLNKSL